MFPLSMDNIFSGLVVYPAVIQKHINEELPFMATENISEIFLPKFPYTAANLLSRTVMACVASGLSRQDAHEEIRVLSHEAAAVVKQQGGTNDLIDRVKKAPFFAPILGQIDQLLDAKTFVGRAPQQVEKFVRVEVGPALTKYKEFIAKSGVAELNV
jgi:adenylosuccinate lyase